MWEQAKHHMRVCMCIRLFVFVSMHLHAARAKPALVQMQDTQKICSWWNQTFPPWRKAEGIARYQTFYCGTNVQQSVTLVFLYNNLIQQWILFFNFLYASFVFISENVGHIFGFVFFFFIQYRWVIFFTWVLPGTLSVGGQAPRCGWLPAIQA